MYMQSPDNEIKIPKEIDVCIKIHTTLLVFPELLFLLLHHNKQLLLRYLIPGRLRDTFLHNDAVSFTMEYTMHFTALSLKQEFHQNKLNTYICF